MTTTTVLRYEKEDVTNVGDDVDNDKKQQHYSIYRNWRVPNIADLPAVPTEAPSTINRNWLKELLQKHDSPSTPVDLRDKALTVAPMVEQSDLPFRLLCRKYGSNLCFTPMIHTRLFQENERYRAKFVCDALPNADRPVIAQLCGPDPHMMLKTAQEIAPYVDGIDLNCGCPQGIARRGLYGAFLLEEEELLLSIVRTLVHHLPNTPISVKVRLLPNTDIEDSLQLYSKLVDCGIAMLTVHGRTRLQTNYRTGPADWSAIRKVVDLLGHKIPILANGMIGSVHDVRECLKVTKADGVMSSEAILEYPCLFMDEQFHLGTRTGPGRLALVQEYMALAKTYPPQEGGQGSGLKSVRMHIHKILHSELQCNPKFRMQCVNADTYEELQECLRELEEQLEHNHNNHVGIEHEGLSWYLRHRRERPVIDNYINGGPVKYKAPEDEEPVPMAGFFGNDDDSGDDDE